MKLEAHETRSALWLKIESHFKARLETLRLSNDGELSPEHTQRLRGRIAQVKEILALAKEPVQEGATDDAALTSDHSVVGF